MRERIALSFLLARRNNPLVSHGMPLACMCGMSSFVPIFPSDFSTTADRHATESLLHAQLLAATGEGVFGVDTQGNCTFINPAGARMLGLPSEQILGRNMHALTHHSHANGSHYADADCPIYRAFRHGTGCRIDSEVFWRQDRTSFPVEYTSYPLLNHSGQPQGAVVTFVDITERRAAAQALETANAALENRVQERTQALHEALRQQQALSTHSEHIREEERTRIAREVHDELGSLLVALKLDIKWMEKRLANVAVSRTLEESELHTVLQHKCSSMGRLIEDAVDNVGRIITDLRPSILDHQGLWAALEWQAQECAEKSELRLEWDCDVGNTEVPASHVSMGVFRIFQEILTNVARHAQANALTVQLRCDDQHLRLRVCDNGQGMEPRNWQAPQAYGVMGMHERTRQLGGQLTIASQPGQGTCISLQVPLPTSPIPEVSP